MNNVQTAARSHSSGAGSDAIYDEVDLTTPSVLAPVGPAASIAQRGNVVAVPPTSPVLASAVLALHKRVLSLLVAVIVCCYLDRTSLAFAALQLCHRPWFSASVFGIGTGLFFTGYVLFQVPSNLALVRFGAPTWLTVITLSWGIVSLVSPLINSAATFYLLRILLGIVEAGAFPGIWLTISLFYPEEAITLPFSVIEASIAVSQILAAPLAAGLLRLNGVWGLEGWQWLYIVQGVVTVALAACLRALLPGSIEEARFLSLEEQELLLSKVGGDRAAPKWSNKSESLQMLKDTAKNPNIWYLCAVKMLKDVAFEGLMYWTPTLVSALAAGSGEVFEHQDKHDPHGSKPRLQATCGKTDAQVRAALITAAPFACAAVAAVWIGHSSQQRNEQRLHIAVPLLVGGALFLLMPVLVAITALLGFVSLTAALMATDGTNGPFWSVVQSVAVGKTAVVALAFVNSVSKAGGVMGPTAFGVLVDLFDSYLPSVLLAGAVMVGASVLMFAFKSGILRRDTKGYTPLKDLEMTQEANMSNGRHLDLVVADGTAQKHDSTASSEGMTDL